MVDSLHAWKSDATPRPRFDPTAVFNVKTISLSRCRGRKPSTLLEAARHNLREIHPERGAINGIDPRRSKDNVILRGPSSAAAIKALAEDFLKQVASLKLRQDHVQAIELMVSVPDSFDGAEAYFEQCLFWAEKQMALPVLSAVVHNDQTCRHMHVLLLPVENGRHVGGAPITRKKLHRLRSSFFDQVAGPAGLQRFNPKLYGTLKRLAVEAVVSVAESKGIPENCREFWPTLLDGINKNPLPLVMGLDIDLEALRSKSFATDR